VYICNTYIFHSPLSVAATGACLIIIIISNTSAMSPSPSPSLAPALALLLLALFLAVHAAKKSSSAKTSTVEKKNTIQTIHDKVELTPVVKLTDKNMAQFITDRPRDYHAILMLTATDPKYKCSICLRAKSILEEAARSYYNQYSFNTSETSQRIAFFTAEVDDAPMLFSELRLESVPHIYALPPAAEKSPKVKLPSLEIDAKPFMEGLSAALKALEGSTSVQVCSILGIFWCKYTYSYIYFICRLRCRSIPGR
jgi:hypothetical protein